MLSLNKSYKNRKVSLTIHCKYKYFDSTVQRAEERRQKFAVCRLPFAVCRLPFAVCRLPFAVNVKLNLSVVLQRTAKKCTKSYNARAEPLFFSLNLLFSEFPLPLPSWLS